MNRDTIAANCRAHEGSRSSVYVDTEGISTAGVGFALEVKDGAGTIIPSTIAMHICEINGIDYNDLLAGRISLTESQIAAILDTQINTAVFGAKRLIPKLETLPDVIGNAMVDMSFQLGMTRLAGFHKMLAAINSDPPDYETAAKEAQNSKWFTQSGNRSREIVADIRSAA